MFSLSQQKIDYYALFPLEYILLTVSLLYLIFRMQGIKELGTDQPKPRKRSNSLPIPKIEVRILNIYSTRFLKEFNTLIYIFIPEIFKTNV